MVGCLLPQRCFSQNLLASESFAGTPGPVNNTNGGTGWAGAWQTQNSSTDVPGYDIVTTSPVTYSGIATSGGYLVGGDAWLTTGRQLDTSATGAFAPYLATDASGQEQIGAPGTTLLFSVLMRKDVSTDDPMTVTLHPGNNPPWWVNSPSIAVGHFGGSSDTNGVRYWSVQVNGAVYQSAVPVVVGQTAFLVVKVTFGATNTVSFYVNPSTSSLPANPSVQVTTTSSLLFRSVAFYGGAGNNQSSIDEIRFAASYGTLVAGTLPLPAAPTNLAAVPGNGSVALSWSSVSGANEYLIYQTVNGVTQLEATSTSPSYLDSGLTNLTAYTYSVVAQSPIGSGAHSASVTAVPRGPAPAPTPGLGINLAGVSDYAGEWPFVDAFKTARPWISQQQGQPWGQGPALQVNANGWVTSLQPGQYVETIMFDNGQNGAPAHYPAGQYTLLYDGSGTLSFDLQSATIVSQTPGRMVVNVPAGGNGVYLMETATDPNNPIHNLRFIMPGYEKTYTTQPFNPLFLQRLQGYKVLRFMEWMDTNGSTVQSWSQRAAVGDYTYSWRGVPLEVMIELANAVGAKAWFNIPAQASNNYVKAFADMIQQNLNPSLGFYLEYSNETWNTTFPQSSYIENQGLALNLSNNQTLAGAYYTAYRSVQIFNIFAGELSNPARMTRVIASQSANSWLSNQTLGFQNAFASADVLAIAPYFNCDDTATGGFGVLGDPSTASQVDAMSVQQVEAIQMQHINNCTMQQMQSNSAVAASYGLKMVAYEGGQSLVGIGSAVGDSAMTALFGEVNRDSGMGPLYNQYLQNWVAAGGDMFLHYSDVAPYSQWGNFGSLEYQDQTPSTSAKYTALMDFASQHP
jgi:hypothetical protein